METKPAPRRSLRRPAIAAVAVVAALIGAAEAIARRVYEDPRPEYMFHPFLGVVRPPGYRAEKFSIDTGERFPFEVNELGLRGRRLRTVAKPAGTRRIIFLGASTTENPNTPEELTFPGLVEAELEKRTGGDPHIEVGNAGVSAANSHGSVAQLAHRVLELEPDVVCVLDGLNDIVDSFRDDWEPTTISLVYQRRPRFKDWLAWQSRLVGLLDARFGSRAERDVKEFFLARAAQRRRKPIRDPDFPVLRGLPRFKANLHRMAQLCRGAGTHLVLMTQPTLIHEGASPEVEDRYVAPLVPATPWNLHPKTLLGAIDAYNEAVREVAAQEGAILVDLAPVVPKDLVHFVDDAHLTAKGNEALARAIVAGLLRGGSVPEREGAPR